MEKNNEMIKTKKKTDKGPTTTPVVRSVPIQILGYSAEKGVNLGDNKDSKKNEDLILATKQSNPMQIGRSIAIQRLSSNDDESIDYSKNNNKEDSTQIRVNPDPT